MIKTPKFHANRSLKQGSLNMFSTHTPLPRGNGTSLLPIEGKETKETVGILHLFISVSTYQTDYLLRCLQPHY